jgi:hypothetical protein
MAVVQDTSMFVQFYCTVVKGKNKVLVIVVGKKNPAMMFSLVSVVWLSGRGLFITGGIV